MAYDPDNVFAKILRREIPADVVFENDFVMAFEDINPQAPVHILIVPKADVATVDDFTEEHRELIGEMILAAKAIAREKGISETGYRLVLNTRQNGGQDVYHVHLHLIGGRRMTWPPG
ncbi:MAG TPA: histidine triad nucleotide-binding protein [Bacteroidetes bacterium]|nr:histidine triad nucleotide-binding protein [Bacteroidota bacterium]